MSTPISHSALLIKNGVTPVNTNNKKWKHSIHKLLQEVVRLKDNKEEWREAFANIPRPNNIRSRHPLANDLKEFCRAMEKKWPKSGWGRLLFEFYPNEALTTFPHGLPSVLPESMELPPNFSPFPNYREFHNLQPENFLLGNNSRYNTAFDESSLPTPISNDEFMEEVRQFGIFNDLEFVLLGSPSARPFNQDTQINILLHISNPLEPNASLLWRKSYVKLLSAKVSLLRIENDPPPETHQTRGLNATFEDGVAKIKWRFNTIGNHRFGCQLILPEDTSSFDPVELKKLLEISQKVFFFNVYAFYMPLPPNMTNNNNTNNTNNTNNNNNNNNHNHNIPTPSRDTGTTHISSMLRFQPYARGRKTVSNLKEITIESLRALSQTYSSPNTSDTESNSSSSSSSSFRHKPKIMPPPSPSDSELLEDWEGIYALHQLKSGN